MKWLLSVAVVAVTIAVGASGAGLVSQRIYPAPIAPITLNGLPETARLVQVTASDGMALRGVVVPARQGMPLLLVFHGNASSADGTIRYFAPLIARGFGVVAASYRGYSGNPGTPDEAGLARDADAFAASARTEAKDAPLWLVGHSLGGGVALGLAQRQRFDLVVTLAAFTRLRDMAPKFARAMVPDAYRNEAAIKAIADPYIVIHGTQDGVVPLGMGQTLHRAAGAAGRRGASFVLLGDDHQPDAQSLATIFEIAQGWHSTGRFDTTALPATIKLVPFGQSAALNP